ncbi:ABC transporter permease [Paracoccus laeviglucosivorans]|uniref:Peptide/nickel transport system permease protein n=1 Tax=Paracoccus laeviglucosivorans TaxID=1197861 RepID=A0A521ANW5_9RHOB|nr:ABC transporter permease [Paracoccus laeviglucosivorans]SMO36330.1 peptide/nickel transport system permease protein [Paracoccus laeviglucosivorans]
MAKRVLVLILALMLLGPLLWRIDPGLLDMRARNLGPGLGHPLGTDQLGRDMLARLMAGGRVSLAVGFCASVLAVVLGTGVGVAAGWFRRLDGALMRLVDLFLALPLLPLLLLGVMLFREPLARAIGPAAGAFVLIVGAIGLTSWMQLARVVRAEVMALRGREFIVAARMVGNGSGRLIVRHLLPNIAPQIGVAASLGFASAIMTESALSFLGFGFPPDLPTWGRMLAEGVEQMQLYPARVLLPGGLILLTVLAVNALAQVKVPR